MPRPTSRGTHMSKETFNAFLGAGTNYNGTLTFQGAIRIDGVFTGTINSEGTLIVGHNASIEGAVRVGTVICNGKINGDIQAADKLMLNKTAVVTGTVISPVLSMEEGAKLDGKLTMTEIAVADADSPLATGYDEPTIILDKDSVVN